MCFPWSEQSKKGSVVGANGQAVFREEEDRNLEGPAVNTDFYFVQADKPIEVSSRKVT